MSARPLLLDCSHRLCIVTGSNTGVGFQTALALAQCGSRVILACRDPCKGRAAAAAINSETSGSCAEFHQLDLASFSSVRNFAARLREDHSVVDTLVLNAGLNTGSEMLTADGLELRYQVNYVSHFLLTVLLLPALRRSTMGRVVFLGSVMARLGTYNFEKCMREGCAESYSTSKLSMIMAAFAFQSRFGNERLSFVSVNPGAVYSDIWRSYSGATRCFMRATFLSSEQGAQPSVHAATSATIVGGSYITPYFVPALCPLPFELHGPFIGPRLAVPSGASRNVEAQNMLWELTLREVSSFIEPEAAALVKV